MKMIQMNCLWEEREKVSCFGQKGGGGVSFAAEGGITFDSEIRLLSHIYPKVDNINMHYLL